MGTAPRMPGKTRGLKRKIVLINGGGRLNINSAIQYGTINVSSVLPKKIYNKLSLNNFVFLGNYAFTTDVPPASNYVVVTPTGFNHDTGILSYSYLSTYGGYIINAGFEIFYIE